MNFEAGTEIIGSLTVTSDPASSRLPFFGRLSFLFLVEGFKGLVPLDGAYWTFLMTILTGFDRLLSMAEKLKMFYQYDITFHFYNNALKMYDFQRILWTCLGWRKHRPNKTQMSRLIKLLKYWWELILSIIIYFKINLSCMAISF